jgi:hypothetical protein
VYVEGTIQGVNGIFTIDTGAARTVISETIYNTIPATKRSPLNKSSTLIGAFNYFTWNISSIPSKQFVYKF